MATWTDDGIGLDQDKVLELNGPPAVPDYVALGENDVGPTAEDGGNTGMDHEVTETRIQATLSQPTYDVNKWVAEFTFTDSWTIKELGIFNHITSGVLYMRHVWATGHSVVATDVVEYTITMTKSR